MSGFCLPYSTGNPAVCQDISVYSVPVIECQEHGICLFHSLNIRSLTF